MPFALETKIGGADHKIGDRADLWHFQDLDIVAIDEFLGARGVRVTKPSELPAPLP